MDKECTGGVINKLPIVAATGPEQEVTIIR